jgi:electron-transferring-flavoprotein dehydrogenase
VKEVWRVAKPLEHVIHTLGWPFRTTRKDREVGGSFIYPMGPDMVAIGLVLGLDYRDSTLSVHDSLQLFKTHPMVRQLLEGGVSGSGGARRRSRRADSWRCRRACRCRGGADGDSAGFVNVPKLKGIHYAMRSGCWRRRRSRQLKSGQDLSAPDALAGTTGGAVEPHLGDLKRVRNMRQALARVCGGRRSAGRWTSAAAPPPATGSSTATREAAVEPHPGKVPGAGREAHVRQARAFPVGQP